MDVNFLLDKAKEVCGVHYDKDLAPRLGVKPTAISNYRKGVSHPDPVVCATLAGLTGIPLVQVIGMVGEARAISREEKAVWRKLAGMTAAILLFVGSAISTRAKASTFDAISHAQIHAGKSAAYTLCEIDCRARGDGHQPGAARTAGPPVIDAEEMPHLQRTSAPSTEETRPRFDGTSDKLPRFWQN